MLVYNLLLHLQIALFAFVAVAAAAPQNKPLVKILSQSFDKDDQGSYQYAFELDNGQRVNHLFLIFVVRKNIQNKSMHA